MLLLVLNPASLPGQQEGPSGRLPLFEAARRGLVHDPNVRASEARSEAADAAVGEASASWFPTLALTASATRYQEPMIVSPIHDFQPGRTPPFDETLIQAGATLSYTLFSGFARPARVRSAKAQASAADAAHDEARQALITRVVATYLSVLGREAVLEAHDRRLVALASELSRARQRRDAGRAADVEVLRVEAALAAARADRIEFAAALDLVERDLARLIGADPAETQARRLMPVSSADSVVPNRVTLHRRALDANPVVSRARREVAASQASVRLARSARWPRLDLFGAWMDRGSAEGSYTAEWNVGVQFSYPVFTGGMVSRGVERADAERRAAAERLRRAELWVTGEVDRARSAVEQARARVASLETAVARFVEVTRIERLRLDAGAGTETDYLSAEAELLTARAGLVEARHREITARVELARVAGELGLSWLQQHLEMVQ